MLPVLPVIARDALHVPTGMFALAMPDRSPLCYVWLGLRAYIVPELPVHMSGGVTYPRPSRLRGWCAVLVAAAVCALVRPERTVADLPSTSDPTSIDASHAGVSGVGCVETAVFESLPADHLEAIAWIDAILRDADMLIAAAFGEEATQYAGATAPAVALVAAFQDVSGVVRSNVVWLERPNDADGVPDALTDEGRSSGGNPVVQGRSTEANAGALLDNGAPPVWELAMHGADLRAKPYDDTLEGAAGFTGVSGGGRRSGSRTREGAYSDKYYIDWPWSNRVGHNMFYWVVGPPASIVCISIALGAVGGFRRN